MTPLVEVYAVYWPPLRGRPYFFPEKRHLMKALKGEPIELKEVVSSRDRIRLNNPLPHFVRWVEAAQKSNGFKEIPLGPEELELRLEAGEVFLLVGPDPKLDILYDGQITLKEGKLHISYNTSNKHMTPGGLPVARPLTTRSKSKPPM